VQRGSCAFNVIACLVVLESGWVVRTNWRHLSIERPLISYAAEYRALWGEPERIDQWIHCKHMTNMTVVTPQCD